MMPLNRVIYDSQVPKGYDFSVVFDIGANVGQTCTRARESFPDAKIFCFEPFDETFQQLKKATDRLKRPDLIDCHCFAFGDVEGEILVHKKALSSQNSLLPQLNKPKPNEDNTERVLVRRVGDFAKSRDIDFIDILKMDVEGFEMDVLKGASSMLGDNVAFVIAEVNFSSTDRRQSYFVDIERHLACFGFAPIGLYDIHYREKDGRLDYCDAVFVNSGAIRRKMKGICGPS